MPRKILSDRYLLDACKIYKSYPLVEIPHYKAKVPYFTEGMTSKARLLVNRAPKQRPENPVAEAMSALSSNQRPAKVLEVSQQLAGSVPEEDWRDYMSGPSEESPEERMERMELMGEVGRGPLFVGLPPLVEDVPFVRRYAQAEARRIMEEEED